jgi:xylan 1,4-beta-xylosidase
MVWNYHDNEEVSAPDMPVRLEISTLPTAARRMVLRHYRIDQRHSNAYTLWNEMGSPQNPTPEQYEKLKEAGQLQLLDSPQWVESKDGRLNLDFSLPRESVSLVELSW